MRIKPIISVLRSRARRNGLLVFFCFLDRLVDLVLFELLLVELFDDRDRELRRDDVEVFLFVTEKPPRGAIIAYEWVPLSLHIL
jgi:hypothetical protein